MALDRAGDLYVADGYGNRIQEFDGQGRFVRKWGGPLAYGIYGPFNGWFITVTALAFDSTGNVFAADFHNDRIQKFTADGSFLTAFGRKGRGPGEFRSAIGVAIADDGSVFATDFLNARVEKWRAP